MLFISDNATGKRSEHVRGKGRGEGPVTEAGLRSQGSLLVQLDLFTHITARSLRDPG